MAFLLGVFGVNFRGVFSGLSSFSYILVWSEELGSYLIDMDGSVIKLDDGAEYVTYFTTLIAGGNRLGERMLQTSLLLHATDKQIGQIKILSEKFSMVHTV